MSTTSWLQTQLYKALDERTTNSARQVNGFLQQPGVMNEIEKILDSGGTTPKDFTLHDAGHSFRVAEKMWELIPITTRQILSDFELALLLLSAYLHDIGMSPDFETVQRHWRFLTKMEGRDLRKKESRILSKKEINEFQQWLDDHAGEGPPDLMKEVVTDEDRANYLLAYYIRYKHNEWSGNWIREKLGNLELAHYTSWRDDLVLICESHHYGLDQLMKDEFNPKPIVPGTIVHLRYLAICLRIADVMENDPERTPKVIFTHRGISAESVKFWLKEFVLELKDHGYVVVARPKEAYIHKAIEETADQIEKELRLCEELMRKKRLDDSSIIEGRKLAGYKWDVDPFIRRDIRPKAGAYEYIQGIFRPNMIRILNLLVERQLYGDPIWAFREMIQNAFDAIKERIAYQVLRQPLNREVGAEMVILGGNYAIDISLVSEADGDWLTITDEGVGMTKGIIERYVLQSGSPGRHELLKLERACRERGFNLGRTGQFGIGILSYFMLAEKMIIMTKREQHTGYKDEESIGWKFEINGLHAFGQLARHQMDHVGTTIKMKLKPAISEDLQAWDQRLLAFLREEVFRSPCLLRYSSVSGGDLTFDPGWTDGENAIKGRIMTGIPALPHLTEVAREIVDRMAFLSNEGRIDGQVNYRVHIPYFRLSDGNSFAFIKRSSGSGQSEILEIEQGHFWLPSCSTHFILMGMKIELEAAEYYFDFPFAHIELEFDRIDPSNLDVGRRVFRLSQQELEHLSEKMKQVVSALVDGNQGLFLNSYALFNHIALDVLPEDLYWVFATDTAEKRNSLRWEKVGYPAVKDDLITALLGPKASIRYRGETVRLMRDRLHSSNLAASEEITTVRWEDHFTLQYELAIFPPQPYRPVPIMTKPPIWPRKKGPFHLMELPAKWHKILVIGNAGISNILNSNHPLCEGFDVEIFDRFYQSIAQREESIQADLDSRKECAGFLVAALYLFVDAEWNYLYESSPRVMEQVFTTLGLEEVWVLNKALRMITRTEYRIVSEQDIGICLDTITDEKYLLEVHSPSGNYSG